MLHQQIFIVVSAAPFGNRSCKENDSVNMFGMHPTSFKNMLSADKTVGSRRLNSRQSALTRKRLESVATVQSAPVGHFSTIATEIVTQSNSDNSINVTQSLTSTTLCPLSASDNMTSIASVDSTSASHTAYSITSMPVISILTSADLHVVSESTAVSSADNLKWSQADGCYGMFQMVFSLRSVSRVTYLF